MRYNYEHLFLVVATCMALSFLVVTVFPDIYDLFTLVVSKIIGFFLKIICFIFYVCAVVFIVLYSIVALIYDCIMILLRG